MAVFVSRAGYSRWGSPGLRSPTLVRSPDRGPFSPSAAVCPWSSHSGFKEQPFLRGRHGLGWARRILKREVGRCLSGARTCGSFHVEEAESAEKGTLSPERKQREGIVPGPLSSADRTWTPHSTGIRLGCSECLVERAPSRCADVCHLTKAKAAFSEPPTLF